MDSARCAIWSLLAVGSLLRKRLTLVLPLLLDTSFVVTGCVQRTGLLRHRFLELCRLQSLGACFLGLCLGG